MHEDLRVRNMTRSAKGTVAAPGRNVAAKSGLNRAMLDAALHKLETLIREKAESAVRRVMSVDGRFSSDVNAALVIWARAQPALMSELHLAEDAGRRVRCAA